MNEVDKKSQSIFIVEDDNDLAEMLRAYFRVQGYTVAVAARGKDAVAGIAEHLPDVVVLDIRLPDINGYEVCRQLRNSRKTQHVPVIFLTEKREREDKLAGLEMGAVDYITKPFDIQELRLRVRNALRRAQMSTLLNPVTGLPEGQLVREQLTQTLRRENWGVVLAGIRGLNKFRDKFGFVAADDVSRAVTLMLANAVQESGEGDNFVGHTDSGDFVILTTADNCQKLAERCLVRLHPSIQYFYPALERQRLHELPESERLMVHVAAVSSNQFRGSSMEDLFAALAKHRL
ncbi:MAG: response regulator [Ardenticatenaceae bacterium]|nr:response regulator [Anaerolineales bacterium]MCB8938628.1 response regulator [Ardenticatenaceae bacterium]MCB8973761.1 response regulator [Ardenticatenaceae bacterium]